jgi:DNA-binding beta-propeller fold protein YncE
MRKDPKSNDFILSCPNFFGKTPGDAGTFTAPPALMRITPDNKLMPYFTDLPVPPNAPMRAGPMGIDFGPDGNLYVADHQYRYDTTYKSRVLRVNVDAMGKPTSADVVVEGTRLSNAVMWNKDWLYLTDTWAYDDPPAGGKSAIYRFSKTELAAATTANPIKIQKPTATTADPHMFATFDTVPDRGVNLAGADGITFDAAGNLYTGKFGDGIITKITFDAMGNKATQTEFAKDPTLTCADGIFFDAMSSNIYVTDSQKNAIKVISPAGTVTTLWENDDSTGVDGLLDQPAEPTIRGSELLIANFDAGFTATQPGKNKSSDAPHTLSVIKLK